MQARLPIPVAFAFFSDGKEWHGGRNYFQSLFLALRQLPASRVRPIALVGKLADASTVQFPDNVQVAAFGVFDIGSWQWNLDRVLNKLTGSPRLMNRAVRQAGARVLSHSVPSRDACIPSASWIPDFQHLHLPSLFSEAELQQRSETYRRFLSRSDLVIVSSEAARDDLQAFSPEHAHKARVLRFCALPPSLKVSADVDVRREYQLGARYFYLPNQFWAHKNHAVALQALVLIAQAHPDVQIVCSGTLQDYRNPQHVPRLRESIEAAGLQDRFLLLGVVPYPHIARLMLESVAVINPSLFEGWSTTVEEAKAIGVPLILSNIPVHREQCTNGEAVFFDAVNADMLAHHLRVFLSADSPASIMRRSVEKALTEHRHRTAEFASAYEAIVDELMALA